MFVNIPLGGGATLYFREDGKDFGHKGRLADIQGCVLFKYPKLGGLSGPLIKQAATPRLEVRVKKNGYILPYYLVLP